MKDKSINDVYKQVSSIVNHTYSEFGSALLVPTPHGVVVFNKYVICQTPTGFEVHIRTQSIIHEFGSAKNSLIWIILDHHLKIADSKRLKELDGFIHSVDIDSKIHSKMRTDTTTEKYLIHSSKLQRDREKQKQFLLEIDKYTTIAQKCQQTRTTK